MHDSKNGNNYHFHEDLATKLGQLRHQAGLSQEQLAHLIGASGRAVRMWEHTKDPTTPNPERLKKLIGLYLDRGVFSKGKEWEEAKELWDLAKQKSRLWKVFDEHERQFKEWSNEKMKERPQPAQVDNMQVTVSPEVHELPDQNHQDEQTVFFFNVLALNDPREVYGRGRELQELISRTYRGGSASIVGPRAIGKTWLMKNFIFTAQTELGSRFHLAYVDAMSLDCRTVASFVTKVSGALGNHLDASHPKQGLETLGQVIADMKSQQHVPIVCIDHFEAMSVWPQFDLDFFTGLRALTHAGLCLVTASRRRPIDIVSKQTQTSPFFNIFLEIPLKPFTTREAEEFAQTKSIQAEFTDRERDFLLKYGKIDEKQWSPLRLQLVGHMLWEDKNLDKKNGQQHHYYRPDDPDYWQEFEQRLEEKYRAVVS